MCELSGEDLACYSQSECVRRSHCAARHTPTRTRHRTHLSGGRADSVHAATADTTKQSCLCRVWSGGVNRASVCGLSVSPSDSPTSTQTHTRLLIRTGTTERQHSRPLANSRDAEIRSSKSIPFPMGFPRESYFYGNYRSHAHLPLHAHLHHPLLGQLSSASLRGRLIEYQLRLV